MVEHNSLHVSKSRGERSNSKRNSSATRRDTHRHDEEKEGGREEENEEEEEEEKREAENGERIAPDLHHVGSRFRCYCHRGRLVTLVFVLLGSNDDVFVVVVVVMVGVVAVIVEDSLMRSNSLDNKSNWDDSYVRGLTFGMESIKIASLVSCPCRF